MKNAIFYLASAVLSLAAANSVVAEPLRCTVSITDAEKYQSFVPKTEFGRSFSEFTLDLSRNPDEAWQHQNICINRSDFKSARFPGALCLIVMSTRAPASPTGSPALYISVWQGKPNLEPLHRLQKVGLNRKMTSDSELVIPFDINAREIRWRQLFKINSPREIASLEMTCSAE